MHGKDYALGCVSCILYECSGISVDWATGEAGIKYAITMELRDRGEYGFVLPPEEIIPTAEETWALHVQAARDLIQEFVTSERK